MKATNKITLLSSLCMLTVFACISAFADSPDVSGNYSCSGNDPSSNPSAYSDNMVIKKNGDVFTVRYIHTDSTVPYLLGTGFFNKDVSNAFSLIYWNPANMGGATELYYIKPDGSLDGVFAQSGKTLAGTEICKKT